VGFLTRRWSASAWLWLLVVGVLSYQLGNTIGYLILFVTVALTIRPMPPQGERANQSNERANHDAQQT
jgi:hypothetical protein